MTDHPSALVSVPVEPTEAMLVATHKCHDGAGVADARDIWSAMLAAAPAAPQAAGVGERAGLIADLEALLAAEPVFVVNHPIQRAINALRAPSREPEGGAVEEAARVLLGACIADFGDPKDFPGDDGWVASGDNGDSAVTFKHMRDLQSALSTREETPAEVGDRLVGTIAHVSNGRSELPELIASALRAQPPAREDAQPVSCQSCGGEVQGWTCQGCGLTFCERDGRLIAERHAPDALREAVEALELAAIRFDEIYEAAEVDDVAYRNEATIHGINGNADVAQSEVRQALAALQAEQGAK